VPGRNPFRTKPCCRKSGAINQASPRIRWRPIFTACGRRSRATRPHPQSWLPNPAATNSCHECGSSYENVRDFGDMGAGFFSGHDQPIELGGKVFRGGIRVLRHRSSFWLRSSGAFNAPNCQGAGVPGRVKPIKSMHDPDGGFLCGCRTGFGGKLGPRATDGACA
jgi:hypothetical protein